VDVDAVVTAKREYHGTLTHLKVHPIVNDEARQPEAKRKIDVLRDILKEKKIYYTAVEEGGEMMLEAQLRIVTTNSNAYVRTDDEDLEADSLPSLPNF